MERNKCFRWTYRRVRCSLAMVDCATGLALCLTWKFWRETWCMLVGFQMKRVQLIGGGHFKGCLQDLRLDDVHLDVEVWNGTLSETLFVSNYAKNVLPGCRMMTYARYVDTNVTFIPLDLFKCIIAAGKSWWNVSGLQEGPCINGGEMHSHMEWLYLFLSTGFHWKDMWNSRLVC